MYCVLRKSAQLQQSSETNAANSQPPIQTLNIILRQTIGPFKINLASWIFLATDKIGSVRNLTFPMNMFLIAAGHQWVYSHFLVIPTLPLGRRIVCEKPAGLLPTVAASYYVGPGVRNQLCYAHI